MKVGGSYMQDEDGKVTLVERTSHGDEDQLQKTAVLKVVPAGKKTGSRSELGSESETGQENNS